MKKEDYSELNDHTIDTLATIDTPTDGKMKAAALIIQSSGFILFSLVVCIHVIPN